ncbi:DNA polymerase III subunit gamma/tau [Sphingosinicellaceae bacterium]|nr:DNA polymerase III subunit gamma/tau [Sphingosinicellaceae bacterium]
MDTLLIPDDAKPEYRVLARKYRPASFDTLLGQDAMVRTLGNAIRRGQLAQAWLLTGVRGVGKTSTARIIAKALNCIGPDGQGGPTIAPCGVCEPCVAIAAGRHIDVIEMDAASNTGVDDVREIIEAVRYASVSARFKIYIVDEVHMLSKNAFNALLKTLEEPPPHVKFIFATTEVQKVPVTVLSRCQRFDLRRIPAETLAAHFAMIVEAEGATAEPEALALIARAAEGSVRDGLSILDQAIAHSSGAVSADAIRDMLGLSDRGAIRSLMGLLLEGDAPGALAALQGQYDLGTDPAMVVQALLELVHAITRAKVADVVDASMSAEERDTIRGWAGTLSFPSVHRMWQLLLKGLAEVQSAPVPIQAAEMALLRVIHASALPDPGELVRRLSERGDLADAPPALQPSRPAGATVQQLREPSPPPVVESEPLPQPADYVALVELFAANREPRLAQLLSDEVRLVDFSPPVLTVTTSPSLSPDFAQRVMACLKLWTGERWTVTLARDGGGATLHEQYERRIADERAAVMADPAVLEILAAFPQAELIEVTVDTSDDDQRSVADA